MISRPKFSCGFALVFVRPSSQTSVAVSLAMFRRMSRKFPSALARSISIWPSTRPASSGDFAAMYRAPSVAPYVPAILLYPVAKWLCQKSVIFSCSGRLVWTIRNSHRWRESVMFEFGENWPRVVMPTYPG